MAYPYYANNQIYMQNMQDLQNMREKIDRQMQQDKNMLMKIAQKEKENYSYIKQLVEK